MSERAWKIGGWAAVTVGAATTAVNVWFLATGSVPIVNLLAAGVCGFSTVRFAVELWRA